MISACFSAGNQARFTDLVYHWQTLVGGFLAVLAAILSAYLLVGLQTSRSRSSAARLLFFELTRFRHHGDAAVAAAQKSKPYSEASKGDGSDFNKRDVEAAILARSYPDLSSTFETAVAKLADGDPELALLLSAFQTFESLAEKMFQVYLRIENRLLEDPAFGEPSPYAVGYLRSGYKHYESARGMIEEINNLIERLYLKRRSFLLRLARRVRGPGVLRARLARQRKRLIEGS